MSVDEMVVTVVPALRCVAMAIVAVKGLGLLVRVLTLYRCKEGLLHFQHGRMHTHGAWQLGSVTPDMAGIGSQRAEEE